MAATHSPRDGAPVPFHDRRKAERWRRAAARGFVLVLQGALLATSQAAPSQEPLTNRVDQPPKPNVVFTIDDSGSMQVHYMPEGTRTFNAGTATQGSVTFPIGTGDRDFYMTDGFQGDPTHAGVWFAVGMVPALKAASPANDTLYQMQFRSPDVNYIYYNPDTHYLPWVKNSSSRFPASKPTAAPWSPGNTKTYDLTTVKSYPSGVYQWMYEAYRRSLSYGQVCSHLGCNIAFHPGLIYRLGEKLNPADTKSYTRYDINVDGNHAPDVKHPNRVDCVGTRCTRLEEQKNFANWFTYYRTRMLLTKASVSEVLGSTTDKVRVGLASINTGVVSPAINVDGIKRSVMRLGVRDLSSQHRDKLLPEVQGLVPDGGTPLKKAIEEVGYYFQRTDAGNPWRTVPTSNANTEELQCRRSYNVLMTDGYYNEDGQASLRPKNSDKDKGPVHVRDPKLTTVSENYGYVGAYPHKDEASNTLADYAMYFYVNDLAPQISNRIQPKPGTKEPYWQHLTQFTVGLGVTGVFDSRVQPVVNGKSPRDETLAKLAAGTLKWPDTVSTDPQRIDDLWHAAVNTGGDFYSASNSTELTTALVNALGDATEVTRREGGASTSGETIVSGALKLVPSYVSSSWTGEVSAYRMSTINGKLAFGDKPVWNASAKVPAAASRKLFTWDGSAGDEFDNSMAPAMKNVVATGITQAAVINYLRGDKSNEGTGATSFRIRTGALPDFVNSPVTFVKGGVDLQYSKLGDAQGALYDTFLVKKAARSGVAFVGGNGGFLHGFAETDGTEVYGFAPKAVLGNLKVLTGLDYGSPVNYHRFFVDGPLLETDAFIPTRTGAEGWKNLLLGTLGAGGRAIFGLDVTDLSNLNVDTVQWEFSSADDGDIGYIFSAPEVGRLNGRWTAFFGNGAHSAAGHAVLFAVDLKDRTLKKFTLEDSTLLNGLMGVRLQFNAKREVQAAYAGDLQGNLWRIDFNNSEAVANWKTGFKGQPLFVAKTAVGGLQPITTKPSLLVHPSGGHVVLFGTGKLIDADDATSLADQTFYGIWDKTAIGQSAGDTDGSAWSTLTNQRSQLVMQEISPTTNLGKDGDTYYNVTSNTVDWAERRGWYIDLDITRGQRVIYPAVTVGGFVLMQTMVPATKPAVCDASTGLGYDFLLNGLTGGQHSSAVWDTDGDGDVDGDDLVGAGYGTAADGTNSVMSAGERCLSVGAEEDKECKIPTGTKKIVDRVWRQIVNPPQPN